MPPRTSLGRSNARRCAVLLAMAVVLCLIALASLPTGGSAAAVPGPCPPPPPAPPPPAVPGSALPAPALKAAIPAPVEVVLACVGQYPITGATFNHWAKVARKNETQQGSRRVKRPPAPAAQTIKEVMGFLISNDWVIGEASELGINVSEATVKRHFDHIRAQQFPHRREFRKFLRNSGQTIADLLLRVRLNILSVAIQKHVLASVKGAKAKEHAESEFVQGFKARWQSQTVCVAAFTVTDCGPTQEPPL